MGATILDITMSLDGFIAGPGISKEHPLGIDGPLLHKWIFEEKTEQDGILFSTFLQSVGAVIVGAHTYTTAITGAWGGASPFDAPAVVLSSKVPDFVADGFTFVHDGIYKALEKAKAAAGNKTIWIMGGANIAQQYLAAGLIDEFRIHIAPVLLGQGTPLFSSTAVLDKELVKTKVIDSEAVTHLFYKRR